MISQSNKIPSALRATTRKCAHLATSNHFPSRDINCGRTIRSAISKRTHDARKLHGCMFFVELELLPIEVLDLHCRNGAFRPILFLWPWPWPDDLRIGNVFCRDILDVRKGTFYVKAFESHRITDRQTDRHSLYLSRRFAGGLKWYQSNSQFKQICFQMSN